MNAEILDKIYKHRFDIFTVRFVFLAISLLVLFILEKEYGFFHIYIFYTIIAIALGWIFSETWVRFKPKLKHAQKLYNEGKIVEVYQIYNELQSENLWASEQYLLDLHRAKLFFDVGNYKRFLSLLDELSLKIEKYPKEKAFYGLLRAFYFEIKNEWSNAKKELQQVYESSTKDHHFRLQACNNTARIEQFLGQQINAKSSYEKAYEILKQKPNAKFFPIVIHNLLFAYAKSKEFHKAKQLLDEYWNLINKKNSEQILQYTNDMTHYARETKDKELLKKSYEIVENSVKNLLKNEQNMALEVYELRMRYNDNVEFDKYFKSAFEKIKEKKDDFLLIEKLNILRELRHVLIQKIQATHLNTQWIKYFRWCTQWNLSLQAEIENSLKNTESSLSDVRIFWLGQLVQLQKAKMAFPKRGEPIDIVDLKQLTGYIEEMISIWSDAENEIKVINEIAHFMDEVYSYFEQTKDLRIVQNFNEKINYYLNIADELLEKYWQRPDTSEFLIALAHFYLLFQNNQEKARKWIERFDDKNVCLQHYAQYLTKWYEAVKQRIN